MTWTLRQTDDVEKQGNARREILYLVQTAVRDYLWLGVIVDKVLVGARDDRIVMTRLAPHPHARREVQRRRFELELQRAVVAQLQSRM